MQLTSPRIRVRKKTEATVASQSDVSQPTPLETKRLHHRKQPRGDPPVFRLDDRLRPIPIYILLIQRTTDKRTRREANKEGSDGEGEIKMARSRGYFHRVAGAVTNYDVSAGVTFEYEGPQRWPCNSTPGTENDPDLRWSLVANGTTYSATRRKYL